MSNIIECRSLCFSYSEGENKTTVLDNLNFEVKPGEKVAIIGQSGCGKSTLLNLIAGLDKSSTGDVLINNSNIAKLNEKDRTSLRSKYLRILYQFHHLLNDFSSLYNVSLPLLSKGIDKRKAVKLAEDILKKGGLEKRLKHKPSQLSGGERQGVVIARAMYFKSKVLILDEPTNHLDIESIIWLENFLKSYGGAIVLVSHDKMFLDNVTNRTIEISLGQIYDYKKPYSQFLLLRGEIKEKQLQAQKNQEKEIKQKQLLINKFKAKASKASMAQSLMKQLDKVELIEVDQDDNATMNVRFAISKEPGKIVVEAEKISKSYGEKQVLENVDLLIERNSKIAFVGQNGQGKSTLAKMMVGDIPFDGHLKLGHNVEIGYFAQNQSEHLPPEKTVLEIMEDAATDGNRMRVRDMLGAFLFGGDAVDKKAKVLSGGERNRLALCKLLLSPFNVLIMDEPTNHLDIASKNVLKEALRQFNGTLILVSHDRDFLQGLTTTVFGFKDKVIKEYLGDIDYFLEQHKMENLREAEKRTVLKVDKSVLKKQNELSREQDKKLRKLKNKLTKIESQIGHLESEILKIDTQLAENYDEVSSKPNFFENYKAKKAQVEILMSDWELIEEEVEKFS